LNKHAVITQFGDPRVLRIAVDDFLPEPNEDAVRIRVEASSVALSDTLIRKGIYPYLQTAPPMTPGYDFVGRIEQVGRNVRNLTVGQRVANLTQIGSNATTIIRPSENLIPVPDGLDAGEAESMLLSYMTAYQMLHRLVGATRGQKILIHGGTGSVGNALVQLAQLLDVEIVTTASTRNLEFLRQFAVTALDYQAKDYRRQLARASGSGFHAIFDGVGLASFRHSFDLLHHDGGVLIPYGYISAAVRIPKKTRVNALMGRLMFALSEAQFKRWERTQTSRRVRFYDINGFRREHPQWFMEDVQTLFQLLESRQIRPLIERRFALDDIVEAHERIERGGVRGRLVITASDAAPQVSMQVAGQEVGYSG
jgi:NADPH:quinone reductase-like Zn-dependent oxidoreductase